MLGLVLQVIEGHAGVRVHPIVNIIVLLGSVALLVSTVLLYFHKGLRALGGFCHSGITVRAHTSPRTQTSGPGASRRRSLVTTICMAVSNEGGDQTSVM